MVSPKPQSVKEFWADVHHNRRHSAGRREDDYAVCAMHDSIVADTKDRVCKRDAAMEVLQKVAEVDLERHKAEAETKFSLIWTTIESLRAQIVGKFTFRIVLSFIGIVVVLIGVSNSFILHKLSRDIDALEAAVVTLISEHKQGTAVK